MKNRLSNLFVVAALAISGLVQAQNYSFVPSTSKIIVDGDSNVHHWSIKATKIGSSAIVDGSKITGLTLNIAVNGLKSGKDGMDDNTFKALKSKDNPTITFKLTEPTAALTETESDVTLVGNLTIAGATKKIAIKGKGQLKAGALQLKANVPLKMTDYKVSPPTAVFGTIKTDDAVLIKADVDYKKG
jgi:polyisoprenoid-binding protein YceI